MVSMCKTTFCIIATAAEKVEAQLGFGLIWCCAELVFMMSKSTSGAPCATTLLKEIADPCFVELILHMRRQLLFFWHLGVFCNRWRWLCQQWHHHSRLQATPCTRGNINEIDENALLSNQLLHCHCHCLEWKYFQIHYDNATREAKLEAN